MDGSLPCLLGELLGSPCPQRASHHRCSECPPPPPQEAIWREAHSLCSRAKLVGAHPSCKERRDARGSAGEGRGAQHLARMLLLSGIMNVQGLNCWIRFNAGTEVIHCFCVVVFKLSSYLQQSQGTPIFEDSDIPFMNSPTFSSFEGRRFRKIFYLSLTPG